MKTLLISFLLALLPIINQESSTTITINGDIDLRPGESTVLTVSPNNNSYTYTWDVDGNWENMKRYYDFTISGNQIRVTPKESKTTILNLNCNVYDENGNHLGYGEVELLWY